MFCGMKWDGDIVLSSKVTRPSAMFHHHDTGSHCSTNSFSLTPIPFPLSISRDSTQTSSRISVPPALAPLASAKVVSTGLVGKSPGRWIPLSRSSSDKFRPVAQQLSRVDAFTCDAKRPSHRRLTVEFLALSVEYSSESVDR